VDIATVATPQNWEKKKKNWVGDGTFEGIRGGVEVCE